MLAFSETWPLDTTALADAAGEALVTLTTLDGRTLARLLPSGRAVAVAASAGAVTPLSLLGFPVAFAPTGPSPLAGLRMGDPTQPG